MEAKLLSAEELKKIASIQGRKLELNAKIYVDQLIGHIKAMEPKKADKPDGDSK